MADLIDMEKLLDQFLNLYADRNTDQNAIMDEVCMMLIKAPHVDAVEVVRCKDCIGQSTWIKDAETGCEICGTSGMYPKGEFDFCSYGDRRKP